MNSNETPIYTNGRVNILAKLLEETSYIVWDQCSMTHKRAFEALDKTFKDIRHNSHGSYHWPYVWCFIQILPVSETGTPDDEINTFLKSTFKDSAWKQSWELESQVTFTAGGFTALLLQFGNETINMDQNRCGVSVSIIEDLINHIYTSFKHNFETLWEGHISPQ